MVSFAWPWAAILLPLPLFIRWFIPVRAKLAGELTVSDDVLLFPAVNRLAHAFQQGQAAVPIQSWFRRLLHILLWLMMVVSVMQPQVLKKHTQVSSRGYDLMLAVDVSRSMLALDFKVEKQAVNRMAVVKAVVGEFIDQRKGYRVGLILFGEGAYVQAPLTLDGQVVKRMLQQAVPTMAGNGTAIGDAIGLAVKKLKDRPAESRVLLLLTDGENTAGSLQPLDAAKLAKQFSIRIYTVGVGSLGNQKGEVDFPDLSGRITKQKMKIDERLLKDIAKASNGSYFRATDTKALEAIYEKINSLEKTEIKRESVLVPESLYRWPLAAAMMVMLLLAGLSLGRGGQW